jgi:hypothetical protein
MAYRLQPKEAQHQQAKADEHHQASNGQPHPEQL